MLIAALRASSAERKTASLPWVQSASWPRRRHRPSVGRSDGIAYLATRKFLRTRTSWRGRRVDVADEATCLPLPLPAAAIFALSGAAWHFSLISSTRRRRNCGLQLGGIPHQETRVLILPLVVGRCKTLYCGASCRCHAPFLGGPIVKGIPGRAAALPVTVIFFFSRVG